MAQQQDKYRATGEQWDSVMQSKEESNTKQAMHGNGTVRPYPYRSVSIANCCKPNVKHRMTVAS